MHVSRTFRPWFYRTLWLSIGVIVLVAGCVLSTKVYEWRVVRPLVAKLRIAAINGDGGECQMAVSELSSYGARAVTPLIKLMHDPNPSVRWWAIQALGPFEPEVDPPPVEAAVPVLIAALNDPDPSVRAAAASMLSKRNETRIAAGSALRDRFLDPQEDKRVRMPALESLAKIDRVDSAVLEQLREMTQSNDGNQRAWAEYWLKRLSPHQIQ